MPSLESFRPTPWLFGCTGHLQSMLMNQVVPSPGNRLFHDRVNTRDGGIIALEYLHPLERGKPTIVVVHGICSSVDTNYMRHTLLEAHEKGFNGVGVLCRGCGQLPLKTSTPWNASQHTDISDALFEIHNRIRGEPSSHEMDPCNDASSAGSTAPQPAGSIPPIVLAGWSIGATMSGLWACENGRDARKVYGVVGVSLLCASFDFFASLENFELDFCVRQMYHSHIVGLLKDYYTRHADQLNESLHASYCREGLKPHEDWATAPSPQWGSKDVFATAATEAVKQVAREVTQTNEKNAPPSPGHASKGLDQEGVPQESRSPAAEAPSKHPAFRRILSSGNIRELDASFTIPLMESHKDPFEYYAATSLQHKLAAEVRVPTLVLHAEDDPVCVARGIPMSAPFLNDRIIIARTLEGGHIAWREGCCPWGRGWGERTMVEFARAAVDGAVEGWDEWTDDDDDDDANAEGGPEEGGKEISHASGKDAKGGRGRRPKRSSGASGLLALDSTESQGDELGGLYMLEGDSTSPAATEALESARSSASPAKEIAGAGGLPSLDLDAGGTLSGAGGQQREGLLRRKSQQHGTRE